MVTTLDEHAKLTEQTVVFDLDNDLIWMTQAANCGSTPAALQNMSVMATLTGSCADSREVTPVDVGGSSETGGAAATSTAVTVSVPSASTAVVAPASTTSTTASEGLRLAAVPRMMVWAMLMLASTMWLLG